MKIYYLSNKYIFNDALRVKSIIAQLKPLQSLNSINFCYHIEHIFNIFEKFAGISLPLRLF